jgi:hypothetical protein
LYVGCALLCYALFSYDDEEKRVENWFNDAFRAMQFRESSVSERLRLALTYILTGFSRLLDRVYGPSLLSFQSAAASLSFCLGFGAVVMIFAASWHPELGWFYYQGTPLIAAFAGLAVSSPFLPGKVRQFVLIGLVFVAAVVFLRDDVSDLLLLLFVVPTTALDALGVALLRKLYRLATVAQTLRRVMAGALAATLMPFLMTVFFAYSDHFLYTAIDGAQPDWFRVYVTAGMVLFLPIATGMFFLVLLGSAFVLRFLAALVPRAIYSVIKFKVLEDRKPLIALGLAFVGLGSPIIGNILTSIAQSLRG